MSAFSFYSFAAPPNIETFQAIHGLIMPVVRGLELRDIRLSKLKSSWIWSTDYHLRRVKFVLYQLAAILSVVSSCVGAATLDGYVRQRSFIERHEQRASVNNASYICAASFNIFVGVYIAFVFGFAFFLDLFFPERRESRAVRRTWKACAVLGALLVLGNAIALTIVVFTHAVHLNGLPTPYMARLISDHSDRTPLLYRANARAVASAILLWPALLTTVGSVVVMFASHRHDDRFGPWSKRGLERLRAEKREGSHGSGVSDRSDESLSHETK